MPLDGLLTRYRGTGCTTLPISAALKCAPTGLRRTARLDAALRELAAVGAVVVLRQGRRRTIRMDLVQLLRAELR